MSNRHLKRTPANMFAHKHVLHFHLPDTHRCSLLPHVARQNNRVLIARDAPHGTVRRHSLLLRDNSHAVRSKLLDLHGRSNPTIGRLSACLRSPCPQNMEVRILR